MGGYIIYIDLFFIIGCEQYKYSIKKKMYMYKSLTVFLSVSTTYNINAFTVNHHHHHHHPNKFLSQKSLTTTTTTNINNLKKNVLLMSSETEEEQKSSSSSSDGDSTILKSVNKEIMYDEKTGRFFESEEECNPNDEYCVVDKNTGNMIRLTLEEKERIFLDSVQSYYINGKQMLS